MPSRTVKVFGAQFTFIQPDRSRLLKSGVHSRSAAKAPGETNVVITTASSTTSRFRRVAAAWVRRSEAQEFMQVFSLPSAIEQD